MEKAINPRPLKVAITGPESTGKSTLAKELSAVFQGRIIAEYARVYLNKTGGKYTMKDIENIARTQAALENSGMMSGNSILILDTDILVCKIWAEHVFGYCPDSIQQLYQKQQYDLTFLMNTDIPWIEDPLREHPHEREIILEKYKGALQEAGRSYFLISGYGEIRLENAIHIAKEYLGY